MLGSMTLIFGGFALMILRAYRRSARAEGGYRPEGLRWTDDPAP